MAAQTFNVIYNCTPTQLETVIAAIIAAGATAQRTTKFAGIIQITSTKEQIDYSYDGQYYLRFFGANPAPTAGQAQAGIPGTEISTALTTFLVANVNPTCGAPVPSNAANVPGPAGSATGPI